MTFSADPIRPVSAAPRPPGPGPVPRLVSFAEALAAAQSAFGEAVAGTEALVVDPYDPLCFEHMRACLPSALTRFDRRLRDALAAGGIELQPPFKLRLAGDGSIQVDPPTDPRAGQVLSILKQAPGLEELFRRITSAEQFVRMVDEAAAFRAAYARDPRAALAQFAWLLAPRRRVEFELAVGPTESRPALEVGTS